MSKIASSPDGRVNYWLRNDACMVVDTLSPLCDASGTPTDVIEKNATLFRGGLELRFYRFIGGGHAWLVSRLDAVTGKSSDVRYWL